MDLKDIDNQLELSESNINIMLNSILSSINITNPINVSDSIYTDTTIDKWITKLPITRGGAIVIDKIIKNPINDKELLLKRQKTNYEIFNYQLETLKQSEEDILWIMNLKTEIEDDMSINLLFPSTYIINRLNNYRLFLDGYHLYKILFIPCSCVIYPMSIFLTPYYYLNKYMHLNLSFVKYLEILFQFLKMLLKPSGNLRKDLFKIVSFLIYIFLYIYGIYQTFIISYVTYKVREKLLIKVKGLVDFIRTSMVLIKRSNYIWKSFDIYNLNENDVSMALLKLNNIKYDISTVYKLWKDEDYKKAIIIILKITYILDVINVISKLKKNRYWTIPSYSNTTTKIIGISNPLLNDNQVLNPVNLNKNLIITGVNAGGKTTYVKSIASNIILSQTFGIVNALKADILLYDAIISFMRVKDEVGHRSYFEAETDCCNNMIITANDLHKKNLKGLFILDEPMHSTPPIEGMSVAYAIAKYLGKLKGITTIITTHFHNLIDLGNNDENFINISVNANKNDKDDKYIFDYKINKGFSKQTIAIELLKKQKFNDEIINSAIEIKNKLCNQDLRYDL